MLVIEYDSIEIDYCVDCSGIWFDAGEIELLLGPDFSDTINRLYNDPAAKTDEKSRKCPTCGKTMIIRKVDESTSLLIDMCPNKGGIWLDGGEINQFVNHLSIDASKDDSSRIMSFIKNVIKPAPEI
jgi:Zn-finger nucleic acid-binding protein